MKYALFFFFYFLSTMACKATTYQIGSSHTHKSPNALYTANVLKAGDTILIDGQLYNGNAVLAVWNLDNLYIKGINGRPKLEADGKYIQGKGIWVLKGNNITVENIEFSEATVPDHNGAGIRLDGNGLTVSHCYFHDNENGILATSAVAGDLLVEYTEFDHNGFGDGYSHNIYVNNTNRFTFRYNYSHRASIGHCVKSRAKENFILYNRIMDEEDGTSSRLIDIPNGGTTVIMGNVLMQGPNAENNNLIGYGLEGLVNSAPHLLYIINNTMVNKREASCIFVSMVPDTYSVLINNIIGGSGTLSNLDFDDIQHNVINPNIQALMFVDEPSYDYHLTSHSPGIDEGLLLLNVDNLSLQPISSYVYDTKSENRQIVNDSIDIGAFEYGLVNAIVQIDNEKVRIYPNPVAGTLNIYEGLENIPYVIYGQSGERLMSGNYPSNGINVSNLQHGMYIIRINNIGDFKFYKL